MSTSTLPLGNIALLIMDCQNDMAHPDGSAGKMGSPLPGKAAEQGLFERINDLSDRARKKGVPVIFVRHVYRSDYADAPNNAFGEMVRNSRFCEEGGWGSQLVDALVVEATDFVVQKNRESAFYGSPLGSILHGLGISHLVLAGISTDGVVEGTARDAQDRDYSTIIVSDCSLGSTDEAHKATISGLMTVMGTVCEAKDLF